MNVDTVDERATDLLLIAGDGYGGTTTFFDGGVVEAAGAGVRVAVTDGLCYLCCTFATSSGLETGSTLQGNTRKVVC